MDREPTLYELVEELRRAWYELLNAAGIGKLVEWLNNKLNK